MAKNDDNPKKSKKIQNVTLTCDRSKSKSFLNITKGFFWITMGILIIYVIFNTNTIGANISSFIENLGTLFG